MIPLDRNRLIDHKETARESRRLSRGEVWIVSKHDNEQLRAAQVAKENLLAVRKLLEI